MSCNWPSKKPCPRPVVTSPEDTLKLNGRPVHLCRIHLECAIRTTNPVRRYVVIPAGAH